MEMFSFPTNHLKKYTNIQKIKEINGDVSRNSFEPVKGKCGNIEIYSKRILVQSFQLNLRQCH